jgi:flagellar hook assembly protein FlgD
MRVRLDVLDVAGRVVRSRELGQLAAGSHALEWDGLDARGAHVGAGLYWVRVRAGSSDAFQRIVRLD